MLRKEKSVFDVREPHQFFRHINLVRYPYLVFGVDGETGCNICLATQRYFSEIGVNNNKRDINKTRKYFFSFAACHIQSTLTF